MLVLALFIGMLLPALIGWLLLRIIEGETAVLFQIERMALGLIFGTTATMFLFFLAERIGFISFTRNGFLLVCILTIILLGWLYMRMKVHWTNIESPKLFKSLSLLRNTKILVGILCFWIVLKIVTGSILLIGSPPYLDDTLKNWNMRGKVYYVTQELVLSPHQFTDSNASPEGVFSYPPTVPLVKTWLASLAGNWNEGIVNAPHIIWYIVSLLLMFYFLRRHTSLLWTICGVYLLSSLPLYLIHGSQMYADLFVSIHVFAAIYLLYNAVTEDNEKKRTCFLRLSGFSAAFLIFTKNESLLLHAPIYILLFMLSIYFIKRSELLTFAQAKKIIIYVLITMMTVAIPWLLFKWTNNLTFGNAKAISGLGLGWQPGVLRTLWLNTFFEANWIFMFPIFIILMIFRWKKAFLSPLVLFTAFFLIVFGQQIFLYMFTSLSTEALRQTGYGRGIVQLMPLMVVAVVMLLKDIWNKE